MKKILSISLTLLFFVPLFAQVPDTIWTKTYGDSSFDYGASIIQTNVNSFIISGGIGTEFGGGVHSNDIWVFGIDIDGETIWSHNYGGMGGGEIVNAANDEFFIAAETFTQGSWEDMEILKINQSGDTLWTKTFMYSQSEYKPGIKQTPDGGLIILGFTYGSPTGTLLIRTDESGDTLWTKFFEQVKTSSPQIDDDGEILIIEAGAAFHDTTFIFKTDQSGNLIRKNKVCSLPYSAGKFLITEDGNYLILGTYQPTFDSSAIWISCIDDSFNTIWSQVYFSSDIFSYPTNCIKSNTEGYLIIGNVGQYSNPDGTILKINDSGELLWRKSYGGPSSEYFQDILILDNNEFFVVGTTDSFGAGKEDAWVLKFSADTTTTAFVYENSSQIPGDYLLYQNYPNPFNPFTKIQYSVPQSSYVIIKVYNLLGKDIETLVNEEKPAGKYELIWNAGNQSSGVYFYQLKATASAGQAGDPSTSSGQVIIQTRKMILLK